MSLRGGGACEIMARVSLRSFKEVKFSFGEVHFRGGGAKQSMPVTSKAINDPLDSKRDVTFIKMATTEQWLVQAATGQKRYNASSFGRTNLLEILLEKVQSYCDGQLSSSSSLAVAGGDFDPMMDLEQDDSNSHSTRKFHDGKRARYLRNGLRHSIAIFDMPQRCPEEDPDCKEFRRIRLWIVDRQQLWLHMDDVEWAVRYLFVQNLLKGVPLVSDDSIGPDPRARRNVTVQLAVSVGEHACDRYLSAVAEREDPIAH